jgi:class III poly(R)-hydroxyalkanoic acid synthase PhaE subunit
VTQNNFFEEWIDLQQKGFNMWQDLLNCNQNSTRDEIKSNNIDENTNPWQETINKWIDNSQNLYSNLIPKDFYLPQEIIAKMLNGANQNQILHNFWEDMTQYFTINPNLPLNTWIEHYKNVISENTVSFLPEHFKDLVRQGLGLYAMSNSTANNFTKPWIDELENLQKLIVKSIGGDQAALIEFNKLWKQLYSSSYGKILNIPQFSMNREYMQQQMHLVNSLINFINTMNKFTATLVKVNQETTQNIAGDYKEMLTSGTNPKTFKEFYDYWWRQNEAAYLKLFGTPEFSSLMAQLLEAGLDYKKELDGLLEKQLESLPYPTKTDMDSLYKTIDTLKRDVRLLKKDIMALKDDKARYDSRLSNSKKPPIKED